MNQHSYSATKEACTPITELTHLQEQACTNQEVCWFISSKVPQVCMPAIFIETHTQRADGKQQLLEMSEDHDNQVATVILSQ